MPIIFASVFFYRYSDSIPYAFVALPLLLIQPTLHIIWYYSFYTFSNFAFKFIFHFVRCLFLRSVFTYLSVAYWAITVWNPHSFVSIENFSSCILLLLLYIFHLLLELVHLLLPNIKWLDDVCVLYTHTAAHCSILNAMDSVLLKRKCKNERQEEQKTVRKSSQAFVCDSIALCTCVCPVQTRMLRKVFISYRPTKHLIFNLNCAVCQSAKEQCTRADVEMKTMKISKYGNDTSGCEFSKYYSFTNDQTTATHTLTTEHIWNNMLHRLYFEKMNRLTKNPTLYLNKA